MTSGFLFLVLDCSSYNKDSMKKEGDYVEIT